jgi:hypothetical protein
MHLIIVDPSSTNSFSLFVKNLQELKRASKLKKTVSTFKAMLDFNLFSVKQFSPVFAKS